MGHASRLPERIPAGSKYVLESHGGFIRRFIEFPDGRTVRLVARKAQSCDCLSVSLVPAIAEAPQRARRPRVPVRA